VRNQRLFVEKWTNLLRERGTRSRLGYADPPLLVIAGHRGPPLVTVVGLVISGDVLEQIHLLRTRVACCVVQRGV
jgi:hypothetical protein